ncbi:MAG: class I SAM-dependent methyltransferase [Betaproteobacteria bacterium]|nr:class I SAM-dependent methyltransferase [Betaproteobacteria bacterium]
MNDLPQQNATAIDDLCRKYAASTGAVTFAVHPDDHIFNWLLSNPVFESHERAISYYFNDGKKSAGKIKRLIERFPVDAARPRFLEFASGYGCVSRHLLNAIPDLDLTSCDIHPEAIAFLNQSVPGTLQLQSEHMPLDFSPGPVYDYVFALSFFSHMPRATWSVWLRQLYAAVKPSGFLAFTTQGEGSRQYHGDPVIPDDGFWFSAQSEQADLDVNEYGQTIVTPSFVVPEVAAIDGARLVGLDLRGWWEHQDLYVVKKKG